ncbi:MAG: hypothetical protein QXG08_07650 [Candidatus Methanomethyliaceae archaeon]
MKNYCYELARLLSDEIGGNIYFAEGIETVNDLRRVLGELRLNQAKASEVVHLIDEMEEECKGKELYKQIHEIKRNLAGVLSLLLKMKGKEEPEAEVSEEGGAA